MSNGTKLAVKLWKKLMRRASPVKGYFVKRMPIGLERSRQSCEVRHESRC